MFTICLVLLIVSYNVWCETDYCKMDTCKEAGSHTMCLFPTNSPGSACHKHKRIMTGKMRQEILDIHNAYRNEIASGKHDGFGPVKNMRQLYWDEELEQIAQRHADQCKFEHDKCRDVKRFKSGQNLGLQQNTNGHQPPQKNFIKEWFNEIKDTPVSDIEKFKSSHTDSGKAIGHFTALIWAETRLVGCGESVYKDKKWHTFYLACNYGPTGNMKGSPILIKGDACSQCPKGTKCGLDPKFPKLCADPNGPSIPTGEPTNNGGETGPGIGGGGNNGLRFIASRLIQILTFLPIFQIKSFC